MDDPNADPAKIARSFRFIEAVNRRLGGISMLRAALAEDAPHWPKDRPMRWIDLGTGSADIPLAIDRWARAAGLDVRCLAVDRHPACLAVAAKALGDHSTIELRPGDATRLDETIGSDRFDYAHAGMFLHHLPDEEVCAVLAAMGRVAERVVWNDLLRSAWSRVAIRVLTIGAPAFVRDDARLSVEKGFTAREARSLAERAGLRVERLRVRRTMGRFLLVALRG
jgi:ubiquinone/menaquinone biosynthesis C-methylase UbiE